MGVFVGGAGIDCGIGADGVLDMIVLLICGKSFKFFFLVQLFC